MSGAAALAAVVRIADMAWHNSSASPIITGKGPDKSKVPLSHGRRFPSGLVGRPVEVIPGGVIAVFGTV